MKLDILTEEQKKEILSEIPKDTPTKEVYLIARRLLFEAQAKLTLKQVVDEPCIHTGGLEEQQMYKSDCPKCWQALKQLTGEAE